MAAATNPPQFESHQQYPYITFPSPTPSTSGPPPLPPANNSCASVSAAAAAASSSSSCTRKVQVIYVLSRRSGQIEHPHLLEVCIPPNDGLYLRDVKKRLAMIRGKRLPSAFAWSYKRSYKTGYVWQDLCDDDLIFPANGCEYVLKGSEILETDAEMSDNIQCNHNSTSGVASSKDKASSSSSSGGHTQGANPKVMSDRSLDNDVLASVSLSSLQISSMVDAGTDAATQTEEELQAPTSSAGNLIHQRQSHLHNSKAGYNMQNREMHDRLHNQAASVGHAGAGRTNEHATELNKNDINSPPSISSLSNAPSPYNNLLVGSNRSSPDGDAVTEHAGNDDVINDDSGPSNDENATGSCKTPGRTWAGAGRSKDEEQFPANEMMLMMANQKGAASTGASPKLDMAVKGKYDSLGSIVSGSMQDSDPGYGGNIMNTHPGRTGKSKSGALSLLQLMSCGSLDIKEQVLPMSLYQLRSKGTIAGHEGMVSADRLPEVLDYHGGASDQNPQQLKSWSSLSKLAAGPPEGNLKSSCSVVSSDDYASYGEDPEPTHNIQPPADHTVHSSPSAHMNHSVKSQSVKNGSKAVPPRSSRFESNGQQDVISIGRSSISDRSLNGSRELQDYAQNMQNGGNVVRNINGRELSRSTEFNRGSINNNGHIIINSNHGSPSVMNSNSNTGSGPARPLGAMLKSVSGEFNVIKPPPATARKRYSTSGLIVMQEHEQQTSNGNGRATTSGLDENVQQIDDDEVEIINHNNEVDHQNNISRLAGRAMSESASASPLWSCRNHQLQYNQQQQQHQQLYSSSNSNVSVRSNRVANNNNANANANAMISRSGPAMDQFKYSPNNGLVYDRTMAQLFEELLAAPAAAKKAASVCNGSTNGVAKIELGDIYNSQNLRRLQLQAAFSNADLERERTLQNAVDLSLPSVEHLITTLHDCPHCGRKVKQDQMKSHMKNCNSPKPNKSNNNNTSVSTNAFSTNNSNNNSINNNNNHKAGKQESMLCQRLFGASPPPTK